MKDYRSLEQKIRDVHQAVLEAAFDRNTKIRMKMANVGRPTDNVEDETSKLAKQGEIKTKVIDEDSVAGVSTKDSAKEQPESGKKKDNGNNKGLMEPGTIKGGKTEVDTEPTTDDRDDDGKKINKSEKATKAANAKAGVKEETMNTTKNFGLPADLIAAVTEALKGGQKKIDANHNGKIDAQDFKILKSKKKVEEAYGNSEGKTATGTKWSDNSVSVSVHHKGKKDVFTGKHDYVAKKLKAQHGMSIHDVSFKKASDMKEEAEVIDERDAGNKVKKDAAVSAVGAANKDEKHLTTKGTGIRGSVADKIRGREVTSGKDRMKEEVEQIDEAYGSSAGKTATGTKWSDNSVSVSVHHDGKKHTFTGKHDYVAKKLKDAHGIGMHQVNFKKASDMKEEVEQIDELDRDGVVKRYADKARKKVEGGEESPEKRAAGRLMAGKKRWGGKGGIPAAKVPAVQREETDPGFSAEELARIEEIASNIDEVVTARKLTAADKAARAKYLEGHAAKMAGMAHHAIKGDAKSFKARNTEHGDYSKEPSKMAGIGLDYTLTKQDTKR